MDCLFCKIINGDIPSYTIYEDEIVKVFLDVNPNTNGHSLIIPKKHYTNLKDIDGNTLNHINSIAKKLYQESKDKLNCEGLTIVQNNDYGQEIKHYHMHLIPRYKNDAWHTSMNKNNLKEPKEIYEIITKK